jgi:hypothetical protein
MDRCRRATVIARGLRTSEEVWNMHTRLLIGCSALVFAAAVLGSSPATACDCGGYGYGAPVYGYYGVPAYGYYGARTYGYIAPPAYSYYADPTYDDYDPPVYAYAPAVNQYSYAAGSYGGSSYYAPAYNGVRRGYVSAGYYGQRRGYVSAGYVGARRGVVGASYYGGRVARVGRVTGVARVGRVGLRR